MIPWGFLQRGRGGLSCLVNCQTVSLSMVFFLFFFTLCILNPDKKESSLHIGSGIGKKSYDLIKIPYSSCSCPSYLIPICLSIHLSSFPSLPPLLPSNLKTNQVSVFLNPRILLLKFQPHLLPLPTNLPRLIQRTHFQTSHNFILPFNNIQCETT